MQLGCRLYNKNGKGSKSLLVGTLSRQRKLSFPFRIPRSLVISLAVADELGADEYEMCVNSIPSGTKGRVPKIGKAKGTLAAVKAEDLIVCFYVPLLTVWLKEILTDGSRVLIGLFTEQC